MKTLLIIDSGLGQASGLYSLARRPAGRGGRAKQN